MTILIYTLHRNCVIFALGSNARKAVKYCAQILKTRKRGKFLYTIVIHTKILLLLKTRYLYSWIGEWSWKGKNETHYCCNWLHFSARSMKIATKMQCSKAKYVHLSSFRSTSVQINLNILQFFQLSHHMLWNLDLSTYILFCNWLKEV